MRRVRQRGNDRFGAGRLASFESVDRNLNGYSGRPSSILKTDQARTKKRSLELHGHTSYQTRDRSATLEMLLNELFLRSRPLAPGPACRG